MRITVIVSERARFALDERIQLLQGAASVVDVVVVDRPGDAFKRIDRRSVPYILDVNRATAAVTAALVVRRRPYVLDTGDDPTTLVRSTHGAALALAMARAERFMFAHALAIICRGSFHQPVIRSRTAAPLHWAPDTVPDTLLDAPDDSTPREDLIATFGSAQTPTNGDRTYCWEAVDIVAATTDLQGLIVVNGPGISALESRAMRLGVRGRITIEGPRPLPELAARIRQAGFVTSIQSDNLAGWVRTTGKLPIALGLGKVLLTTRVGEATRTVPDRFLISPGQDDHLVREFVRVVREGIPSGWSSEARTAAEAFRRTSVGGRLRAFLASF